MAICKNCAWFPWKPGTDLLGTPAIKCHPDQPARRWLNESATLKHDCQNFKKTEPDNTGDIQTPESGTGTATEPDNTGGSQTPDAGTGAATEPDNAGGSQEPEAGAGAATMPDNTGSSQPADGTGAVINNDTNTGVKDEVKKTTKRNHSTGAK